MANETGDTGTVVSSALANLNRLPGEIQTEILSHLADRSDAVSTLRMLGPSLGTSKNLRAAADAVVNGNASHILNTLSRAVIALDGFPVRDTVLNSRGLSMRNLENRAARLPLERLWEREANAVCDEVQKFREGGLSHELVRNLAANLDLIPRERRAEILQRISERDRESGFGELLATAITRSKCLEPHERLELARATLDMDPEDEPSAVLRRWAPNMSLLEDETQAEIIAAAMDDVANRAVLSAAFAENFEHLAASSRMAVFRGILDLPTSSRMRWESISVLCKKIPVLWPSERHELVDVVVDPPALPQAEQDGLAGSLSVDDDWRPVPEFFEVESLHHLSCNRHLLDNSKSALLKGRINEKIGASGTFRAQLIDELESFSREALFSNLTNGPDAMSPEIVVGLSMRLRSLSSDEIETFSEFLRHGPIHRSDIRQAIGRSICDSAECFSEDQRTIMVRRYFDALEYDGPAGHADGIEKLGHLGPYLRGQDIMHILNRMRQFADTINGDDLDFNEVSSIASSVLPASRLVRAWATSTMAKEPQHLRRAESVSLGGDGNDITSNGFSSGHNEAISWHFDSGGETESDNENDVRSGSPAPSASDSLTVEEVGSARSVTAESEIAGTEDEGDARDASFYTGRYSPASGGEVSPLNHTASIDVAEHREGSSTLPNPARRTFEEAFGEGSTGSAAPATQRPRLDPRVRDDGSRNF